MAQEMIDSKPKAFNPWDVDEFVTSEKRWSEKTGTEKLLTVLTQLVKIVLMLVLLYLFIVSLSLMANSFRILGGKASGRAFRDTVLFDNPFAGLVTGILVTVLVQSSSTSTSIIITMTAGDLIKISNAIPMIFGANIGTSVTNTIVSLGHMANKDEYRRAFAGATVHDMFNLLNVCLFLPIEAITGMLSHIASAIVDGFGVTDKEDKGAKTEILKAIVKPVNNRILAIDKKMITSIAKAKDADEVAKYDSISIIKHKQKDDNHMFLDTPMSDPIAGTLMVFVSLGFLCLCLILMVKVLQSIFRGRVAIWTRRAVNFELESVPWVSNYFLIVFGAILTVCFQSSSVTTSTLTPLVGIGLIRIEKMFAFTVGANVGTCVTGILSALVTDKRKTGLTVAFTHLLFNLLGMVVWYPVPMIRNIPIAMAKLNGNLAADMKIWPTAYIIGVFLVMPAVMLGLSAVHVGLFAVVFSMFMIALIAAVVICYLRLNNPSKLPARLHSDPRWLPNSLRINKEEDVPQSGDAQAVAVSDADIGKYDWRAAPFAWGSGWFVLFALLVALTNAKWADIKFPSFDKRDHVGFSAWKACSYGYKDNDMAWAKPYDVSACTDTVLQDCAAKSLAKCQTVSFSNIPDINKDYQESWTSCRSKCPMFKWQQWCENQACGGTLHQVQCQNVSTEVMRPYVVEYGPKGADKFAWKKGDLCRDFNEICDNGKSAKVAGDCGVVGLVCVILGQISLITYNAMHKKRDMAKVLAGSLACWCGAWIFTFASWTSWLTASKGEATCVVEDVSGDGAVLATGAFQDIARTSYTFGWVLGSWLLIKGIIIASALRLLSPPVEVEEPTSPLTKTSPTAAEAPLAAATAASAPVKVGLEDAKDSKKETFNEQEI